MPKRIRITVGSVSADAELNDSPTAARIAAALPITGRANTWGLEIYFTIPVQAEPESTARADCEVGELGYWPPGSAFCIFFGRTPASSTDKPRAASPVNILGRVLGSPEVFRTVSDGQTIRLELLTGPETSQQ